MKTYEQAVKEGATMQDFIPTSVPTLDFLASEFVMYEKFYSQLDEMRERLFTIYAKKDGLPELWQLKMAAIKLEVRSRVEQRCADFQEEWRRNPGWCPLQIGGDI